MIGKSIGPYLIKEKIGEGGMGIVYKGIHTQIEQVVAIKVLYPQYAKDEAFRERFKREAKIQAKLHHPNVVNILNYLEDQEGNMYLVMEYVGGGSLEDRMKTGRLSLSESVSIIVQVLNALSYMHTNGIIHRDIKPSNIMFADSLVKVSDFGIAKPLEEKGFTKTGTLVGTVWYMAPEIIKGEKPSPASDLYAVGVILYQLLTGRSPFFGKTDFEIMKSHLENEPPPPEKLNPSIPAGIGEVISKALAKDPKQRFSSAEEFKGALISWFSSMGDKQKIKDTDLSFVYTSQKKRKPLNYRHFAIAVLVVLFLIFALIFISKLIGRREKPKDIPGLLKMDTPKPVEIAPSQTQDVRSLEKTSQTSTTQEPKEESKDEKYKKPGEKRSEKRAEKEEKRTSENKGGMRENKREGEGGKERWEIIK